MLRERLETTWLNVARVRMAILSVFGYDPVIENFDQSPFHMNEVGSKNTGSLHIRGCGPVALKEGHSATRERWTANTMATSSLERALAIPPLELMFRIKSGGGWSSRGCGRPYRNGRPGGSRLWPRNLAHMQSATC